MPLQHSTSSSHPYQGLENGDAPSSSRETFAGPKRDSNSCLERTPLRPTGLDSTATSYVVIDPRASNGLKHSISISSPKSLSLESKSEKNELHNRLNYKGVQCNGESHYSPTVYGAIDFGPHPADELVEEDHVKNRTGTPPYSNEDSEKKDSPVGEAEIPRGSLWKHWAVLCSLAYGNFAVGACYSLQAPFFPKEATKKGASPSEYGLVLGVYQLTMFIFSPIFGKLISYTNPKTLLGGGMTVVGTAAILFGLIDRAPNVTWFLSLAFLVRILEGIGSASLSTGMYSYIAMSYARTMATTFTTLEMFFGLGLILGPTLGGLLYDAGGYQLPFLVVGSVTLLDALLKYFILDPAGSRMESSGKMLKFYLNLGVWLYFLIIFTTFVLIGFNTATLEPHLRSFNLTGIEMGGMCAIQGAVYSLMSPVWGKLCDLGVNPMVLGFIGSIMTAVSLVIIGPLPFIPLKKHLNLVGVALGVSGLGIGGKIVCTYLGLLVDTKARGFPDDVSTYGLASSMIAAAMSLGAFAGPSIGGYLLDNVGFPTATFYLFICEIVVVILVAIALLRRFLHWRRRDDPERAPLLEVNHPNVQ